LKLTLFFLCSSFSLCLLQLLNLEPDSEGLQEGKNTEVYLQAVLFLCALFESFTQVIVYAVFDVCFLLGTSFLAVRTVHNVSRSCLLHVSAFSAVRVHLQLTLPLPNEFRMISNSNCCPPPQKKSFCFIFQQLEQVVPREEQSLRSKHFPVVSMQVTP
jgi:hypothetical protein